MDFIEKLPSSSGFNTILVIVDHLSKQAIFISTHDTITSAELAYLFIIYVFSKHGVLSYVMSDHGLEFVSHFFHSLGTALNMRLQFTSRYHRGKRSSRTDQPDVEIVPSYILQLPIEQLVRTITPSRICLQQYS